MKKFYRLCNFQFLNVGIMSFFVCVALLIFQLTADLARNGGTGIGSAVTVFLLQQSTAHKIPEQWLASAGNILQSTRRAPEFARRLDLL